ncbi:MAG: NUDIX hydrolase [Solirubrobacteraceae bacterium]
MERPPIAERLKRGGPPTPPRQAASVILVRDAAGGLELLLVQRNPAQRFMGGFWVFPGGAVDAGESHQATAVRELGEEAGVADVAPQALVAYSRWITPELVQTRFDTHFFLARAPAGARAHVDGRECVDLRWTTPRAAVDAYARDELALVFPTLKLLEGLAAFASAGELLAHARRLDVRPILPRVVLGGDEPRVVLPGEPGYEVGGT